MRNELELYNTGPGTPAGRYMRLFWHPIHVAEKLEPGRAIPMRIMNEDFTLYRGQSGAVHLTAFRCAHRGTQLSTGWVEGDSIRCRYHGWKYDGTGQCIEQPGEEPGFAEKVKIRSYPVREYVGLIFAYLGEGEPPPIPRLPDFENEGAVIWSYGHMRPCNFWTALENDPTHLAFTHRGSEIFRNRNLEVHTHVSAQETGWGVMILTTFPSFLHVSHHGIPNMTYSRSPDRDRLSWKVPLDDEKYLNFQANLMHLPPGSDPELYQNWHTSRRGERSGPSYLEVAESILRGELSIEEVEDRSNMNWIQDYVTQVGQGHPRDYLSTERLGRSDIAIIDFRKIWEREIRAMLEGRPLKRWGGWERLDKGSGADL